MWPRPIAQLWGWDLDYAWDCTLLAARNANVPFRASGVFFYSIKVADNQVADVDGFRI